MQVLSEPRRLYGDRVERQLQIIDDLKDKVTKLEMAAITQLEPQDGPLRDTSDLISNLCVVQNLLLTERREGYQPEPAPRGDGLLNTPRKEAIALLVCTLRILKAQTGQTIELSRI